MKVFLADRPVCAFEYTFQLLEAIIESSSHTIVDKPEEADLIVFPSTCSATESLMNNTVNYIESILKRKSQSAETCLMGCLTRSIYNDGKRLDLKSMEYFSSLRKRLEQTIDFIVPDGDFDKLMQLMFSIDDELSFKVGQPYYFAEQYLDHTDAAIYVARGCMNSCTFCKATYQNFQLASIDIDNIKKAIDNINEKNTSSLLYLIASNVTQYGLDLYGKYMLSELLKYINRKSNITTIGLMGFAFKDAIKQDLVRALDGISKPLMLAGGLESGSDRILSLMNKGYTAKEIQRFVKMLREQREVGLSLNIITGFPTETYDDINKTIDLLSEIGPHHVNLCTYTDSPFIPSHNLPQLHPQEILEHTEIYSKRLAKIHIPHIKRS